MSGERLPCGGPARCRGRPYRRYPGRVQHDMEPVSGEIFARQRPTSKSCCAASASRGAHLASAREPCQHRPAAHLLSRPAEGKASGRARASLKTLSRDVVSLSDTRATRGQHHLPAERHARPREQRADQHHQDLLGRRGGLLPPTLIASIYGMNFTLIPELDWPRLSRVDRPDDHLGRHALPLFQAARLAVAGAPALSRMCSGGVLTLENRLESGHAPAVCS